MATETGNGKKGGGARTLWIAVLVLVVAVIAYFVFFTRTPDEGTRTDSALQPAEQSEPPGVETGEPDTPALPSGGSSAEPPAN